MDNFKIIYRILRYLEKAMDYDEPDIDQFSAQALGLSEQRRASIMRMLSVEGYVDGLSVKQSADGSLVLSFSTPRITLKGLEYLQESSLMQKAARLAKGIAEIIP